MGIVLAILCMSMTAAVGILMLILACAYNSFQTSKGASWVLFIVIFYILVPIPTVIEHRLRMLLKAIIRNESLNAWAKKNRATMLSADLIADMMLFLACGLIISSFAMPIILARAQIIKWGAVGAVMVANIFIFGTMFAFFKRVDEHSSNEAIHIKVDLAKYQSGKEAVWDMLKQMRKSETEIQTPV